MEREDLIAFIKRRMKELGYNQRSLALAIGEKEDTIRNFFRRPKTRYLKAHIYLKVMEKLGVSAEEIPPPYNPSALRAAYLYLEETFAGLNAPSEGKAMYLQRYYEQEAECPGSLKTEGPRLTAAVSLRDNR